jgi:predicted transcriptional regulator
MGAGPKTPGDNQARKNDPQTAHEAAAISSLRKEGGDAAIVGCLAEHGPRTSLEVSRLTGRKHNNISSRFKRLEEAGFIVRTGRTRRDPETRCASIVWAIKPAHDPTPAPRRRPRRRADGNIQPDLFS